MKSLIYSEIQKDAPRAEHWSDSEGNPAGGVAFGTGFAISWQNGPLGRGLSRKEPNGAFVEDILAVAIDRLEFYQSSRFACAANAEALKCLLQALDHLQNRTRDREQRAVEGTHAV